MARLALVVALLGCGGEEPSAGREEPPAGHEPSTLPPELSAGATTVKDVVRANFRQLSDCYEQGLKAHPAMAGRVEVAWVVEHGVVTSARVVEDTMADDEVADCIVGRIRTWTFPETADGEYLYPFIFKPKG